MALVRSRVWIVVQLAVGWLPVWAIYTMIIVTSHPGVSPVTAGTSALRAIVIAALLGLGVHRLTSLVRWPEPFRVWFLALHALGGVLYALVWVCLTTFVTGLWYGQLVFVVPSMSGYVILGIWIYISTAGTSYAIRATARATRAEALAAESQLAALRSQLNPHFLFNALHTVVHLIPRDPDAAARAAERVAGLLRRALEEDREEVPLADEWSFVHQYLEVERERFGDRLAVQTDLPDPVMAATLPSFALQTLVENAVRHGVAPRAEPTEIRISAQGIPDGLRLMVEDDGAGPDPARNAGTGLSRLRERLDVLYGGRARLVTRAGDPSGFRATLEVPQ